MGVTGLWGILEPTGKPIKIQSLRGKVLSVDVSIWLHQSVKGFRDRDGNPLPNAHLLGVFHRVCKLLSFGIKPVFVFDGGVPALKKQTMNLRKKRKIEALDKSEISRNKLLTNLLKQELQKHYNGTNRAGPSEMEMEEEVQRILEVARKKGSSINLSGNNTSGSSGSHASKSKNPSSSSTPSPSPSKKARTTFSQDMDGELDIGGFGDDFEKFREKLAENYANFSVFIHDADSSDEDYDDEMEEDVEEKDRRGGYRGDRSYDDDQHFSTIISPTFDELPLQTQHELLYDMQESRKQNSWGKIDQMPKDSNSFSSFQMERLRKRATLQKKIQSVQKEMGNRHIHLTNFDDLASFNYDQDDDDDADDKKSNKKSILSCPTPMNPENVVISQNHPEKSMIYIKTSNNSQPSSSSSSKQAVPSALSKQEQGISIEDYVIEGDWTDSEEEEEAGRQKDIKSDKKQQESMKVLDLTEEEQLQQAIKLSLLDDDNEKHTDDDEDKKLNIEEKKIITVVENEEENLIEMSKQSIQEKTPEKPSATSLNLVQKEEGQENEEKVAFVTITTTTTTTPVEEILIHSPKEESGSDNDSDFEEVEESITEMSEMSNKVKVEAEADSTMSNINKDNKPVIQIQLTPSQGLAMEDDIFADIFNNVTNTTTTTTASKGESNQRTLNKDIIDIIESSSNDSSGMESVKSTSSTSVTEKKEDDVEEGDDEIKKKLELLNEWEPDFADLDNYDLEPVVEETSKSNEKVISKSTSTNQELPRTFGLDPNRNSTRMISTKQMQAQERLNVENKELKSARGNQERIATTITDQMYADAQELLALFGVPYIISPMEAESQCAFLDTACLTDGTITDDSDVWLFGAQRVYKNFFSQGDRHLELYEYANVVKTLNLDREKLVLIAIMTGSDYTDGVEGVGPVKALEILSEFSNPPSTCPLDILIRFKKWWERAQLDKKLDAGNKLREAFRKIKLKSGFPSRQVYDAYLDPTIDTSTEPFRWGVPDLDAIRAYTKTKFGWEQKKCDTTLLPLLKTLRCQAEETAKQLTMDQFVTHLDGKRPKRKIKSKRLKVAMKKLKKGFAKTDSGQLNLSSSESSNSFSSGSESENEQPKKQQQQQKGGEQGRRVRVKTPATTQQVEEDNETRGTEGGEKGGEIEDLDIDDQELDALLKKMGVRKERVRRSDNVQGFSPSEPSTSSSATRGTKVKLPKKQHESQTSLNNNNNDRASQPAPAEVAIPKKPALLSSSKKSAFIPQKARAEFQKEMNKKKAIELLKKGSDEKKTQNQKKKE